MKVLRAAAIPRPAHLAGLERYEPGRPIADVAREFGLESVVKLASNENPLGPSPRALEAVRGALSSLHRYPDGPATELRSALAARLGFDRAEVVVGNGSTDLIDLLARAFLGPQDDALVSAGAFARFRQVVCARNGRAREVPMSAMTHDLRAMAAAADERTRLLFVANPNNPTGTWNRGAELHELFDRLPPGVLVVLDEAYFEFARAEQDYPDGLELVRAGAPLIVLRTFSKVYGLAGLRVGYGVAARDVIEALDAVREPFNSNSLAQAAARAALHDQEHVERTLALTLPERRRLAGELRRLGLGVLPSAANFLFVETGRDGTELYRRLLLRGVIVRPMRAYGFPDALRVSVGTRAENDALLAAAAAVLAEAPSGR